MSGDVQRTPRKAFAFSVESILSKDEDSGDGRRDGVGAKRSHVVDGMSPESKRAKLEDLGGRPIHV